jgi:hypothetical protein
VWHWARYFSQDFCPLLPVSLHHQWALRNVAVYCDDPGLSVNSDRTGLVAVTRRRKFPWFFEQRLFGRTFHRSVSVRYLGVILDSQLNWREQVDVKVRKVHSQSAVGLVGKTML